MTTKANATNAPAAAESGTANAKLETIYLLQVPDKPPAKALTDILALIVSIVLPLLQKCLGSGGTHASIAAAMRQRPVMARAAVRRAMQENGLRPLSPEFRAVYASIVEAGTQATETDVRNFELENSF